MFLPHLHKPRIEPTQPTTTPKPATADDWRTVPGKKIGDYPNKCYEFIFSDGSRRHVFVGYTRGMKEARELLRGMLEKEAETEPEPTTETQTESTLPDFWKHETEVQEFGRTLQESQVATLGGFSYSIEPNGTAWQFVRTLPDGSAETIVSGRFGIAFDSFARVVGYCVQDIRGRYVIAPEELPNGCRIESRFHKRRERVVFVVLHPEPLAERFRSEETRAKRLGGWYAREFKPGFTAGGFMFLNQDDARTFANGFKPARGDK